jgi:two-component system, cell cycle response regulator
MAARILVIEDNLANLELMTYLLNAFGHTPLTCTDGEQGIEMAARERPDLIICDIQLPTIDGYEVARRLKADDQSRATPLVAVTAFAMAGDRDRMLAAGFDGYLSKPIVPESFVGQIEEFLPSELRVSLPPRTEEAQTATSPSARGATPALAATILVVDDSQANLSFMVSLLASVGYHVIEARSTQQALRLARAEKPDLIISDLHMPFESGRDLLRAAKADALLKDIPFVLISSTAVRPSDFAGDLSLGATKIILRPIEPEALLAEVEASLKPRFEV